MAIALFLALALSSWTGKRGSFVPKWVTEHNFLQPRAQKSAISLLEKSLNGSREFMALTVLWNVCQKREHPPAWGAAKLLLPKNMPHVRRIVPQIYWSMHSFLPKWAWGLSSENEKLVSVWLLTIGIKSTWLPWQYLCQGDFAIHPYKHVFHFHPKGSGLIS